MMQIWIYVPKIHDKPDSNLVTEITNRLPDTSLMKGEDHVGCGHYGAHSLNAYIRNKYGKGTNNDNAAYFCGGRALIAPEPNTFTLREVVKRAGGYFPGGATPFQHWNNQPLYILDELAAYTCGTITGIHAGDTTSGRVKGSYRFAKDMLRHAKAVVALAYETKYPYAQFLDQYVRATEELHRTQIVPYLKK